MNGPDPQREASAARGRGTRTSAPSSRRSPALDPVEACRWANAAAAAVVASRGQVSPPRLEELQAILAVPAPRA